ncbi:MAG: hypothetical protein L7U25_02940 [Candidatus Poseidonia sp.]|nr:hypothetical protein [Poseidonia sp.]
MDWLCFPKYQSSALGSLGLVLAAVDPSFDGHDDLTAWIGLLIPTHEGCLV